MAIRHRAAPTIGLILGFFAFLVIRHGACRLRSRPSTGKHEAARRGSQMDVDASVLLLVYGHPVQHVAGCFQFRGGACRAEGASRGPRMDDDHQLRVHLVFPQRASCPLGQPLLGTLEKTFGAAARGPVEEGMLLSSFTLLFFLRGGLPQ